MNYLLKIELLFLDLFFPKRCVACGAEGTWSCAICEADVMSRCTGRVVQCGEYPVFSGLDFTQPLVRELLHSLKYNGIYDASRDLVRLMVGEVSGKHLEHWLSGLGGGDIVLIPVPIGAAKRKMRGYNQAEEIARELGGLFGLPVCTSVLLRKGRRGSQVGKGRIERAKGLAESFWVREDELGSISDKTWIVVDDLHTTGNTLNACFETLRQYCTGSMAGITAAYER
jgi:predicted amidophosphoribosyltransferase